MASSIQTVDENRPDTVGQPHSAENCVLQMPSLKAQELGEYDAATVAVSRGNRLANSIRPLSAHDPGGAIQLT